MKSYFLTLKLFEERGFSSEKYHKISHDTPIYVNEFHYSYRKSIHEYLENWLGILKYFYKLEIQSNT